MADAAIPQGNETDFGICGGNDPTEETRMLFGVVRAHGSAEPLRGASVTSSWQTIRVRGVAGGRQRETGIGEELFDNPAVNVSVRDMGEQVTTDGKGFYAICDLPVGRPIRLHAEKDGRTSREASVTFETYHGGVI